MAVVGGVATDLAFPGTGWWPLAYVGVALLLLAMGRDSARWNALVGLVWGLAFFGRSCPGSTARWARSRGSRCAWPRPGSSPCSASAWSWARRGRVIRTAARWQVPAAAVLWVARGGGPVRAALRRLPVGAAGVLPGRLAAGQAWPGSAACRWSLRPWWWWAPCSPSRCNGCASSRSGMASGAVLLGFAVLASGLVVPLDTSAEAGTPGGGRGPGRRARPRPGLPGPGQAGRREPREREPEPARPGRARTARPTAVAREQRGLRPAGPTPRPGRWWTRSPSRWTCRCCSARRSTRTPVVGTTSACSGSQGSARSRSTPSSTRCRSPSTSRCVRSPAGSPRRSTGWGGTCSRAPRSGSSRVDVPRLGRTVGVADVHLLRGGLRRHRARRGDRRGRAAGGADQQRDLRAHRRVDAAAGDVPDPCDGARPGDGPDLDRGCERDHRPQRHGGAAHRPVHRRADGGLGAACAPRSPRRRGSATRSGGRCGVWGS